MMTTMTVTIKDFWKGGEAAAFNVFNLSSRDGFRELAVPKFNRVNSNV